LKKRALEIMSYLRYIKSKQGEENAIKAQF